MAYDGEVPADLKLQDGYSVETMILPGVTNEMEVGRDEIFGPVLSVIPFQDEEEAIRQANDKR